jgi:hypothetical protein
MSPILLAVVASIAILGVGSQLVWNGEAIGLGAVRVAALLLPIEMKRLTAEEWSRHVLDLSTEGRRMAPALWGLRTLPAAARIAVPTTRREFDHRFPDRRGRVEALVLALCLAGGMAGSVAAVAGVVLLGRYMMTGPGWPLLLPAVLLAGLAMLAANQWHQVFVTKGWAGRALDPAVRLRLDRPAPVTARPAPDAASVPAVDAASGAGSFRLHLPSGRAEMVRRGPIDLLLLNTSGQAVEVLIGTERGVRVEVAQKTRALETEIGAVHVTNLGDGDINMEVVPADPDHEATTRPRLIEPGLPELASK